MAETMKTLIHRVQIARQAVATQKAALEAARACWEAQNADFMQTLLANTVFLTECEAALRTAALAIFAETKSKKPAPGVGIREVKRLEYDQAAALAWAVEHNIALHLDVKTFEKIAKATTLPMPFVTERVEYVATFATDLAAVAVTPDG